MGAGRQWPAGRAAQDDAGGQDEGDVGVTVSDRLGAQIGRGLEAVGGEKLP